MVAGVRVSRLDASTSAEAEGEKRLAPWVPLLCCGAALVSLVSLLLIFDLAWPFRLAALFLLACAVDEIVITYLLPECRHDVPSVFHAARLRRRIASER